MADRAVSRTSYLIPSLLSLHLPVIEIRELTTCSSALLPARKGYVKQFRSMKYSKKSVERCSGKAFAIT